MCCISYAGHTVYPKKYAHGFCFAVLCHYDDIIMGTIASQITSLTIVYSIVYSGTDQRKHQSSASLAFVLGIHRGPRTKGQLRGKCFHLITSSCCGYTLTDFPISIRLTSLALWQSNDCPSASKATLMNMDKYFMWIHYERLHNHNKTKHNKTVCIFHGMYILLSHVRTISYFCMNTCCTYTACYRTDSI